MQALQGEGEDEVRIDTKFDTYQTVWLIATRHIYKRIECETCGHATSILDKTVNTARKAVIKEVAFMDNGVNKTLRYFLETDNPLQEKFDKGESELYATEAEALEAISKQED